VALGLLGGGIPADAVSPNAAGTSKLERILLEQTRAYLRARGGSSTVPQPVGAAHRTQPADAVTLIARMTGRSVAPAAPTAEILQRRAIETTYAMLLDAAIPCCLCSDASTCSDGLFCNGSEICAGDRCLPGAPACVDGDPCTTEACVENTDHCVFTPVPPPAEVAWLEVGRTAAGSPVAALAWTSAAGATGYDVPAGDLSQLLGSGAFAPLGLVCAWPATAWTDGDPLAPGEARYYLVRGVSACGQGTSGDSTLVPDPRDAIDGWTCE